VIPPSPNLRSPKQLEYEVVHGPPPNPELTDPELRLDHQSLSTDSEPADVQVAAEGKSEESRHISSTTRDVGNAAQMELQPDGSLLDPGE
jgi:hypothetical protein